jgi:energy-converting hydrogenase Eha subunit C
LDVLPTATGAFTQTICANEVFTFNGVDLNTAGTYLDTLSAANGCDSVVTLTLNVLPTATGAFTQTICANEVFTFNGVDLNTAGTYLDTLSAANGCDSVVTLTLNVLPTATGAFTQTICANQTFTFNGVH